MTGPPSDRLGPRPDRPVAVELAAALLICGGAFGIIQSYLGELLMTGSLPMPGVATVLAFVLDGLAIGLGIAIRSGRAWVLTLNVSAIYAFLYLSSLPNQIGLVFGLAQLFVVGALIARRPWFDAMRTWRALSPADRSKGADRWVASGAITRPSSDVPDADDRAERHGPTDDDELGEPVDRADADYRAGRIRFD